MVYLKKFSRKLLSCWLTLTLAGCSITKNNRPSIHQLDTTCPAKTIIDLMNKTSELTFQSDRHVVHLEKTKARADMKPCGKRTLIAGHAVIVAKHIEKYAKNLTSISSKLAETAKVNALNNALNMVKAKKTSITHHNLLHAANPISMQTNNTAFIAQAANTAYLAKLAADKNVKRAQELLKAIAKLESDADSMVQTGETYELSTDPYDDDFC